MGGDIERQQHKRFGNICSDQHGAKQDHNKRTIFNTLPRPHFCYYGKSKFDWRPNG